jgi:hypothetical protein
VAAEAGEQFRRQGHIQEAIAAFDRAMAADARYAPARWAYGQLIRDLPVSELMAVAASDQDKVRVRMAVERFFQTAFHYDMGQIQGDAQSDGTTVIHVPVTLRIDPVAAETLAALAHGVDGNNSAQSRDGVIDIEMPRGTIAQAIIDALLSPRRVYLKLLSRDQRVLGVYSDYRWVPMTWLSAPDAVHLRVATERTLHGEAVFPGLTARTMAHVAGVRLDVDPVPRERAMVTVEPIETQAQRGRGRPADMEGDARAALRHSDDVAAPAVDAFQRLVHHAWNPPVSERPWGPQYLPSNERTTVMRVTLSDPPAMRVVRSSGDPFFDNAAAQAITQAITAWSEDGGRLRIPLQSGNGYPAMRVQFRLVKDIPPFNIVQPASDARAISSR